MHATALVLAPVAIVRPIGVLAVPISVVRRSENECEALRIVIGADTYRRPARA